MIKTTHTSTFYITVSPERRTKTKQVQRKNRDERARSWGDSGCRLWNKKQTKKRKRVLTRVKTSHQCGSGGHGLARHSGTCDWSFLVNRGCVKVGVTKAGHFLFTKKTKTAPRQRERKNKMAAAAGGEWAPQSPNQVREEVNVFGVLSVEPTRA